MLSLLYIERLLKDNPESWIKRTPHKYILKDIPELQDLTNTVERLLKETPKLTDEENWTSSNLIILPLTNPTAINLDWIKDTSLNHESNTYVVSLQVSLKLQLKRALAKWAESTYYITFVQDIISYSVGQWPLCSLQLEISHLRTWKLSTY